MGAPGSSFIIRHLSFIMSTIRTFARNVFSNWFSLIVTIVTSLYLSRFLILNLGDDIYGLWILIGSITGYFGLVDFGLRTSVGRYVAFYLGRGDEQGARDTIASAICVLCAASGVVAALTCAAVAALPVLIPPEAMREGLRLALFLAGINLAVTFVGSAFAGILMAAQRFDLLRMVDILQTLARVTVVVLLVRRGGGIVALASATLGTAVAGFTIKYLLALRFSGFDNILKGKFSVSLLRTLFGYGVWNFICMNAENVLRLTVPVLLTNFLGLTFVTFYSLGERLIRYAKQFISEASGVLLPVVSRLDGREDHERQRRVFTLATRMFTMISVPISVCLLLLGRPFFTAWLGERYADMCQPIVAILLIGFLPTFLAMPGISVIMGKARNRMLALLSLSFLVTSTLAIVVEHLQGVASLTDTALAIAIPRAIGHGIITPVYAARITGVRYRDYFFKGILAGVVAAAPQVAFLLACLHFFVLDTLLLVAFFGCSACAIYLVTAWFIVLDRPWRVRLIQAMPRRIRRVFPTGGCDAERGGSGMEEEG